MALCLQVVWQRVISIHGGVDLFSSATVVAAFMAGLGLGKIGQTEVNARWGRAFEGIITKITDAEGRYEIMVPSRTSVEGSKKLPAPWIVP